ncbi:class I SAM-dependent methyltransferase [Synechococcus sp. Nb3U1]|uniref:class I SAM-dependent methyltransferase n=1 Tax=Synechococcus sp. Nb3U1 TaxID=1914529 RepID=UPI001F297257|nr:class I SAM-dependent methyltransferase [Synechococcus sp. Nb3U1]MCF2972237.1 class I SAM-dependent methyltransferase [Synechococcus sp. Nb3U1]
MLTSPSALPVHLYRCLSCGQEGLAQSPEREQGQPDRIYCPSCGQIYPLLASGAVDFIGNPPDLRLSLAQAIAHSPGFAWGYDRLWRPWALSLLTGESFGAEREGKLLTEWIGAANPVLDLGTAGGYWSRLILAADPQRTVMGLDNAAGVLVEAAQQARPDWHHYNLVRARAEQLPLASGAFGAVISGASLNELPLDPSLQEIARILKPGGVFVSMHSQQIQGWGQTLQQWLGATGLRFFSESELQQHLLQAGLHLERYLSFGWVAFVRAVRS